MINNLCVCVGAQKAGTSWLFSVLSQDDRFSYCPFVKEVHYFDYVYCNSPHLNNWRAHHLIQIIKRRGLELKPHISASLSGHVSQINKNPKYKINNNFMVARRLQLLLEEIDDNWYESLIKPKRDIDFALDITPDYSVLSDVAFSHISSLANNIKLIFIMRDPVERSWSGLLQGKKKTPDGVSGFIKKLENNSDTESIIKECESGPDVGARSNYYSTLVNLRKAGLLDKTLLLNYSELNKNPDSVIKKIYAHLGLEVPSNDHVVWKQVSSKVYATEGKKDIPNNLKVSLSTYYRPMIDNIYNEFGFQVDFEEITRVE